MGKKRFLFLLLLSALLLMVSCSVEEAPQHTTANTGDTTVITSQTVPEIETQDVPINLSYELSTNHSEAGITVPSASIVSGTLLTVNDEQSFRYNVASLLPASKISSMISVFKEQNLVRLYGNKSSNYLLASSQLFLKADAFQPWESLMSAFVADTGKKTVQIVNAYIYKGEESLYSSFVTGYSLAINLFEDNANYSLASSEKTITVNGKTMTCLDWFQDHCVQYGFVYTGLEGSQARTVATFRYVGVPHALAMQELDYVDTQEYTAFLRNESQSYIVTDYEKDVSWVIGFYPADKKEVLTKIDIPKGAVYTMSGNNMDGFIVAYYVPES